MSGGTSIIRGVLVPKAKSTPVQGSIKSLARTFATVKSLIELAFAIAVFALAAWLPKPQEQPAPAITTPPAACAIPSFELADSSGSQAPP